METKDPAGYVKTVKILSWGFAIFTGILAVFVAVMVVGGVFSTDQGGGVAEKVSDTKALAGLVFLPIGGYVMGMAIAIVFAPAAFLECPEGKRWMRKVGTKSITAARVVALVFALFATSFLTFLVLALLTDDFKKPLFGQQSTMEIREWETCSTNGTQSGTVLESRSQSV